MIDVVGEYSKRLTAKVTADVTEKVTEQITEQNIKYAIKGFILAANVSNEVIKKVYPSYTDEMINDIREEITKA